MTDLRNDGPDDLLAAEAGQLDGLAKAAQAASSPDDCRGVYLRVRWLKRRIALANPMMQFGKLLFAKRVPPSYSHLVMQYFGWRARPGGGLFVLDQPGRSLACRDILDGQLAGGSVLEPRLSFDAQRIVFSFVADAAKKYDPAVVLNDRDEGFYHVYEVNVDGTGLRQLTVGPVRRPDADLPARRRDRVLLDAPPRLRPMLRPGFSRRWHVYTLHRMDGDGGNLRTLSVHDTNEWFPTVSPSGHHSLRPLGLHRPRRGDAPEPLVDAARRHQSRRRVGQRDAEAALQLSSQADPRHGQDRLHRLGASLDHRRLDLRRRSERRARRPSRRSRRDHARGPLPRGRNAERQRIRRTQGVLRVALAAVGEVLPGGLQPDAAGLRAAGRTIRRRWGSTCSTRSATAS